MPPSPRPPIWADLSDDRKEQLLRVLNRMLTDRLAAGGRKPTEGDHDPR
jgi:hypothetical protein